MANPSLKFVPTAQFSVLAGPGEGGSAAAAAAAAPGSASAAPAATSIDQLVARQGEAVRALKAAKAPKADIDAAVQVLLQLKLIYLPFLIAIV